MECILDKSYWQSRYQQGETGWDTGGPSTPLAEYIDQLHDPSIEILIPGCGNAWEADYLLERGFHNLTLLDVTEAPLDNARARIQAKNLTQPLLLVGDFFKLELSFDLVLEQTFFCAINPVLRPEYVRKMHEILKPGGKLAGVVFSVEFPFQGPPFGALPEDYEKLFEPYFHINTFAPAYNSIAPRKGNEYFLIAERKA
jgi:SAM-dependent methyltransferase